MNTHKPRLILMVLLLTIVFGNTFAQNPIIRDQFTADPSARVFNGKVYVYPSHDIRKDTGRFHTWFCMEDYHVFSSENLTDWKDHGMIVSQYEVPWVDSTSYSMWAPDCIEKNGKYYFYFPSRSQASDGKEFRIGVAVADQPYGPFKPQPEPIENVHGIDPNVLIDDDGQAYLYWSANKIFVAKLKDNMLELASEPKVFDHLPTEGLIEGPWVFKRKGTYYLTYPHVEHETERLEYAMGDSPMGPFKQAGVIMDEWANGCWTNHHSVINYENQWYLFYHHNDYSPDYDKNRSARIDSLFFNPDGTIQKVDPTLRGVGLTQASEKIQIDRYSAKSSNGASIAFNDTSDTFEGWKTILNKPGAWIKYNAVDFADQQFKSVQVMAQSTKGGTLQIRLNQADGPVLSEVSIPEGGKRQQVSSGISKIQSGVHNLVVTLKGNNAVEFDWVRFVE